jgi:hypothetical protein
MFQHIINTCRRIVKRGSGRQPLQTPPVEDRRVWVRYPGNGAATLAPVSSEEPLYLSARVRDVSRGGINLVVFQPFVPGDLLSIELPGSTPEARNAILAWVVHVKPVTEEAWSIGCVFSVQLGDAELAQFGARRVQAPAADQRQFVRFSCQIKATYQFVDHPESPAVAVEVANISPTGIGLLAEKTLAPGSMLTLNLQSTASQEVRTILACVVHVITRPGERCILGCHFIRELSEQELNAIL